MLLLQLLLLLFELLPTGDDDGLAAVLVLDDAERVGLAHVLRGIDGADGVDLRERGQLIRAVGEVARPRVEPPFIVLIHLADGFANTALLSPLAAALRAVRATVERRKIDRGNMELPSQSRSLTFP